MTTVVVVGGGIAGLAAARSLSDAGCEVVLLEAADEFTEVGAGLGITRNGLAAAAALGVESAVCAAGRASVMTGYDDHLGNALLTLPTLPAVVPRQSRHGPGPDQSPVDTEMIGIHRQKLLALLLDAASGTDLRPGCRVSAVAAGEADGAPAIVHYRRGHDEYTQPADLVVAADGLRSRIRSTLFASAAPHYSGKTCWRALVLMKDPPTQFRPVFGPATEFGALAIDDDTVYWYGYVRAPRGAHVDDEKAMATAYFAQWSEPIRSIVAATDSARLMRHDVYHLHPAPHRYTLGRVVLVGDAAHAVVPTMGQGANSALEDGVSLGPLLGAALRTGRGLGPALTRFDAERRPRAEAIAAASRQLDHFGAGVRDPLAVRARNRLLRALPVEQARRRGGAFLSWQPPAAGGPW